MLVGMPAPWDLYRVEVDGQVLITVGASVLFSYEAADSGLRHLAVDLDAVQMPWCWHAYQHGLACSATPTVTTTTASRLNTFCKFT